MGNQTAPLLCRRRKSTKTTANGKRFKVVLVGGSGVGKTALLRRLLDQVVPEEYEPTTAAVIGSKLLAIADLPPVIVELWEIPHRLYAGKAILETYLQDVDAILLVYDVTSPSTFKALEEYLSFATRLTKSVADRKLVLGIVGNKIDASDSRYSASDTMHLAIEWAAHHSSIEPLLLFATSARQQLGTIGLLRSVVVELTNQTASM